MSLAKNGQSFALIANSLFSTTHTNEAGSRWLEEEGEASSETLGTSADHLHSYGRAEA